MTRHRDASWFDDLFSLLVVAPVWMGPAVAAAGFLIIRYLAPLVLRSIGSEIPVGDTLALFAPGLSWVFAGVVLMVWIGAEVKKRLDRRLLDRQTGADTIRALSWDQFEELVAEAYRRRGYVAEVIGRPAGDGGVDIVLHGRGERVLVQCKHWKARSVGVARVRELTGVVSAEGADRGVLITSGAFTPDATAFADSARIELLGGAALSTMIAEVQRRRSARGEPTRAAPPATPRQGQTRPRGQPAPEANLDAEAPACPDCGRTMALRTARRGASAGSQFWGCTGFPQCRGTRDL